MKLLVDDRWFGATGIGRYAKEILQRAPSGNEIECLSKTWAIKNPLSPLLLGFEINRKSPDLFWSPGFMPPMNSKVPYIVSVHDLIHLKYGSKLQIIYYNMIIRPLLKKAEFVLTGSEYSKREILSWAGLSPEKVVVNYYAASPGFTSAGEKFSPGYRYLLYVGNKRYHKNLARLIIAFSRADVTNDLKLVFTGDVTKELLSLADKLNISDRLVFLGFVAEADLPSIYRGAMAVILVSLYEGFGIPIVESMACGTAVIASNVSAMPEVAGGAGLLVDPENIDEICSGIEQVVNSDALREKLILNGKKRSHEFSWEASAKNIWDVFASVKR
ncbi:MAG: glycosyltransferase family 1 protein [Gammaproteobacteria bacterium]|nr:glycosyltransferase family 1 protein [Gammaproteobacteria bacterium]